MEYFRNFADKEYGILKMRWRMKAQMNPVKN